MMGSVQPIDGIAHDPLWDRAYSCLGSRMSLPRIAHVPAWDRASPIYGIEDHPSMGSRITHLWDQFNPFTY